MISSKDILNGNDGLSFPSPRLCREMMVYLFHRYSSGYGREANYDGLSFPSPRLCRDVIHTKVVYFFHLRY